MAEPAKKQQLYEKLRPASFRKVPFMVDGTELETGRRVQINEYPQRDKPYSQDLGRATRRIEFDAFVIGEDYVEKANALLGAMEEYGSGALIHPWFGTLKVNVMNCRVVFDRGLGHAIFSLSFVESGDLAFPSSAASTAALSRKAAAKLEKASVSRFAKVFAVLNKINALAVKALTLYGKVLSFLSNPVFALASMLGFGDMLGNLGSLSALFGMPINLGWNFAGLLNLSGKAKTGVLTGIVGVSAVGLATGITAAQLTSSTLSTFGLASGTTVAANDTLMMPIVRGLTRMAVDPVLAQPATRTYTTASAAQMNANEAAILANTRQLLLVQAVGLSSYLDCSIYDDVLALKNELAAALDAETLVTDDDDLYQALMEARAAMCRDLTERSRKSARLTTLTPADVLPMLVMAYDYYENAGRDAEITQRNKIRHPGFVPVAPLRVLSA
jgi:prophage DNA circulation protein